MHLSKIELQGFKSFASKTRLTFTPGVTAIVGPNGSGKSNIADAIRWVFGEQSAKSLRAKKNEDVIFAGSHEKARLGFAEVSLTFDNSDQTAPLEYPEIVMTRRLYRNGESEYLLNKGKTRLADILMFLAKANVGQKSYGVVGQGMIDAVINVSPEMRKDFFDEAVGVKSFQLKRDAALHKLQRSQEHLLQSQALLTEIEPQLRSLTRQIKKLERRNLLEQELRSAQRSYYGSLWGTISRDMKAESDALAEFQTKITSSEEELTAVQATIDKLSASESRESIYRQYQIEDQKLSQQQQAIQKDLVILRGKQELRLEKLGQKNIVWLNRQIEDIQAQGSRLDQQLEDLRAVVADTEVRHNEHRKRQEQLNLEVTQQENEFLKSKEQHHEGGNLTLQEIKIRLTHLYRSQEQFLSKMLSTHSLPEFEQVKHLAKKISMDLATLLDDLEPIDASQSTTALALLRSSLEKLLHEKDEMMQTANQLLIRLETSKQKQQMLESQRIEIQKKKQQLEKELDAANKKTGSKEEAQTTFEAEQNNLEQQLTKLDGQLRRIREKINSFNTEEQRKKDQLIHAQKTERRIQDTVHRLQAQMNEHDVVLARLQTRQEDLETEMRHELPEDLRTGIKQGAENTANPPDLEPKIQHLKKQLEHIGGIDPETQSEYEQIKERFDFLSNQSGDLESAIEKLEQIIDELDATIQKQFQQSFSKINKRFDQYFQILFDGGQAKLSLLQSEENEMNDAETAIDAEVELPENPTDRPSTIIKTKKGKRMISGIEISASPPGKKLKHLSFLSGGEKALTSIALICAIIANNPPPFVLLDEVEASLDEANSERFAAILKHLEQQTQFIIITHNRVTMHQAQVIYGVTMGKDGVSRLLSVKMEELTDKMIGNGKTPSRKPGVPASSPASA